MTAISEKVAQVDAKRTLVGIITAPVERPADERPALIILNTGIVHRVGHNRMFVTFAREMAQAGYGVLRFDLSGLGDSGNRHGAVPPLVANLSDIREAIDWMERRGYARIVLMGLCSGADQSIVYAGDDPRVAGLVLLDPTVPPTRRFAMLTRRRRVIDFVRRNGVLAVLGHAAGTIRRQIAARPDAPMPEEQHDVPATDIGIQRKEVRDYMEAAYRRAVARGVQIFALFTAGLPHQHIYREQILEAFPDIPFGRQLRLEYLSGVDHTFVRETDRRTLFDLVGAWLGGTQFAPARDARQP